MPKPITHSPISSLCFSLHFLLFSRQTNTATAASRRRNDTTNPRLSSHHRIRVSPLLLGPPHFSSADSLSSSTTTAPDVKETSPLLHAVLITCNFPTWAPPPPSYLSRCRRRLHRRQAVNPHGSESSSQLSSSIFFFFLNFKFSEYFRRWVD